MPEPRAGNLKYLNPIAVLVLTFLAGCGQEKPADPFVGDMTKFSWGGQVTPERVKARMNANGREVVVSEYAGRFVWADYAAPWCAPCIDQASAITQIEGELKDQVVFLTVVTSEQGGYGHEPTGLTARNWANRTGLEAERVVAAAGLTGWTIPTHILYSPEGQSLYRSSGYLSGDQIKTILFSRMSDYKNWTENGVKASWMRFGNE